MRMDFDLWLRRLELSERQRMTPIERGDLVRDVRQKLGLTQADLGQLVPSWHQKRVSRAAGQQRVSKAERDMGKADFALLMTALLCQSCARQSRVLPELLERLA